MLAKELERGARFNVPLSLILFDVDRLSTINKQHGYGVGDKVLERLGILMRQYFRQHDWVARYTGRLVRRAAHPHRRRARDRARRASPRHRRRTARLHRPSHRARRAGDGQRRGDRTSRSHWATWSITERLMADAETALERAKQHGRNRVEHVDGYAGRPAHRAAPAS